MEDYADDAMANLRNMWEKSGNVKGYFVGFSAGTTQMFIALTKFE